MDRFLTILLLSPLLLQISPALATVNVETLRGEAGGERLKTTLSFSLSHSEGNTEITQQRMKLRTDYRTEGHHLFLVASRQLGDQKGARYMNRGFAHLRLVTPLSGRFSGELFGQKEYNDFTLLRDRTLAGGGLRTLLAEGGRGSLHLGLGLMREREVLDTTPGETTEVTRSTNYLSGRWDGGEGVALAATAYYQPDTGETDDYRLLFEGEMGIRLTERLTFTVEANYRYDSEPPAGVERYDLEITNGISLSF